MRLAFRLEIAPSGWTTTETMADEEDSTFTFAATRLRSLAPIIEIGERGCVVGLLFRRQIPTVRVSGLDDSERKRIVETQGRALLSDYWGAYIAVLRCADGSVSVLRDPSGMMTCYMRRNADRVTLASDLTTIAAPGHAVIDYESLARMLAGIDLLGRRAGIAGVEELLPGERLVVNAAGTRVEQAWSPWDHVHSPKGLSFDSAAHALRETLKGCIGAWSTCFDHILVGVSGGLDSSTVAAALGPRTPGMRCLTMVEPGTTGDERRYVQALIKKLGTQLETSLYDMEAVDIRQPVLPHFPLPFAAHYFPAIAAAHSGINAKWPVDAYFSGNGGDNIFCSLRSAAPLADHILAHGVVPSVIGTARDVADLTGAGMVEVIRKGWDRIRRRRAGHRVQHDLMGLGPAGRAAALSGHDPHPWLFAPPRAFPGKAAHIALLARSQKSIELYPRATTAPQITPLLSQPIVELCLSIPTWYWVRGGRDRAVARAAVADLLPALIVQRRTKGGPTGFLRRVFNAQGDAAIRMLADGRLIGAGVLDPDWLQRVRTESWKDDGRHLRLLAFAAAEAWVRWWEEGSAPSA
mgnify:CR=1 FL=1